MLSLLARGQRLAMGLLLTSGQLAIGAISAAQSMQTKGEQAQLALQQQQQQQDDAMAAPGAPMSSLNDAAGAEMKTSFPLYMRLIATLVCLIIFTIGVCGNLLVPLVVIKTRYLRNSTNLFLINLSVADLLVLIVCMPLVLVELHSRPETWLLGETMCKVSNFVEMLAANGSIFTILAISFERYYAICKPLKAGYKCTRLRATIIICLIWLLACLLTSPILIMAKSVQTTYIDGSLVDNCILETDSYWPKMYVFVSMFAFFCLPLLVLMLVYWLISRRLIRESIAMITRNAGSPMGSGGRSCTPSVGAPGAAGNTTPTTSSSSPEQWQLTGGEGNHIPARPPRCAHDDDPVPAAAGRTDVVNNGKLAGGFGHRQRRLPQVTRSLTEDQSGGAGARYAERTKLIAVHSALLAPAPPEPNSRFHANHVDHLRDVQDSLRDKLQRHERHDCNNDDSRPAASGATSELDTLATGSRQRNSLACPAVVFQQQQHATSPSTRREPVYQHSMSSKVNLIAMAHNISNNFHIKRAKARTGSQPLVTHHLQAVAAGEQQQQLHYATVYYMSKKHQMDSRRQVVVMLAFVVACFFLLFAPYRVFTIWLILSTEDQVQSLGMETYYNLTYFSRILIYLHSAINPIAYNLISTKFRRAFMSILLCRGSESRRQFTTDTYRHVHEINTNNTNTTTKTNSYSSSRLNSKVNRSSSQNTNTTHATSDKMISSKIVDVYANGDHEVNDDLVP